MTAHSGIQWPATSQLVRAVTQFAHTLLIATILAPSDFGLFALASGILGAIAILRDFGIVNAIIQRSELTSDLLNTAYWTSILASVCCCALVFFFSTDIATAFRQPQLDSILPMLASLLPISATSYVSQALLERDSRFYEIARVEIFTHISSAAISLLSVYSGFGIFSLVIHAMLVSALPSLLFSRRVSWRPSFRFCKAEFHTLQTFSIPLIGFNAINYLLRNADDLLIGRFLGTTSLGIYSLAYKIMLAPIHNISSVTMRVTFPRVSRIKSDLERLRIEYLCVVSVISYITLPIMLSLFAARQPVISIVFNSAWQELGDLLGWLLPLGAVQSVATSVGVIYLVTGKTRLMFRWAVAASPVIIGSFCIGMKWGLTGVAISYSAAYAILFVPSLVLPFRLINLRLCDFFAVVARPFASSVVTAGWMLISDYLLFPTLSDLLRLLLLTFVALFLYLGVFFHIDKQMPKTLKYALFPAQ